MEYSITLRNIQNIDNNNIYERIVPSHELRPNFSFRPTSCKYLKMPIMDDFKRSSIPELNVPDYNINEVFNPSDKKPHYSGFANNIDNESKLRNQFFALQGGDKHLYIPGSNSDMFINKLDYVPNHIDNFKMFDEPNFDTFNPNFNSNIGIDIFNNSTRVQLKNI